MDDSILIEPYRDGMAQGVVDLILPIQRGEFGVDITAEDQPDLMEIPEFYQHGRGNFWVATCNGEVVGSIAFLDIGQGLVALRKMFVKREFRGRVSGRGPGQGQHRGIAASLLEEAVHWAREQSVRAIYLGTVDKYHAAHRFYEKNGFVRVNREDLPASFPVMEVDSMFYVMTFPEQG